MDKVAKLVTVHLLVEDGTTGEISDAVVGLLQRAEAAGDILDWGFAAGGMPCGAVAIPLNGYNETDFYERAGISRP